METKTSYSSMAAKPPPKANNATPTGQQPTKAKNPSGPKRNPNQFLGHNQTDLKGILIPEDANAKHYPPLRRLKETLMDMYKEELKKKADEWIQYQRDMEKMYRLAFGQIDDGMKAKLKGLKSWQTIDSSKCIVELLKALLCTQQRNLDAASYVKMMKQNLDVVKSLGGTLVCKATVSYKLECNPKYSAYDFFAYLSLGGVTRTAIDQAVEQRALAALIIEGSDTDSNNYALQQNNYPATSVEALDMVVAFKDSNKPSQSRGSNRTGSASDNGKQRDPRRKKEDQSNQESALFAQQGTGATNLSTDQHSRQLLMTAVESDRLETNKVQTLSSTVSSESTIDSSCTASSCDSSILDLVHQTNEEEKSPAGDPSYCFGQDVEYLFSQSKSEGGVNPYWILLDSQSSLNLIVNPALVTNIRPAPNNGFMNIHCNSGVSRTNLIADLPRFGVVWFYEGGLANVLSLALVPDQYQVIVDTSIDNALYVHKDGGTRRFQRSACNLYYCDMREHNGTVLALDTVKGKANSYSALDCSRARKARDMQEILCFPTSHELIKMIDNNIIKDCPITRRDIKNMTDIYEDIAPIPDSIQRTYQDVALFVNIITVNGIQFLVSILRHIRFQTEVAINNMKQHVLAKTIRAIAGQYASRGLRVAQVHTDNQFECIQDSLLDMEYPITVHCVPAGQYEPTIKRSNRTLKENIQCVINHIPVNRLPR
eukprot:jgi/Psemu1/15677/gm1.15677_g